MIPVGFRMALVLAGLALGGPAAAQAPPGPPPADPWEAPERFLGAWLRAGAFLPASGSLPDPHAQLCVGIGIGLRLIPFATLEAEGGWMGRDFAAPGGTGGRASLSSRAVVLGLRLHHPLLGLEPSAFGGVAFLRSSLEVPAGAATGVETALSTGFALGLGLDLPLGTSLAFGLDWRFLKASASLDRLGGGPVALGGHSLGGAVRLYWP